MKNLKSAVLFFCVFSLYLAQATLQAQLYSSSVVPSSDNAMNGVNLQQSRVFRDVTLKAPGGIAWKSEKLFTLREARSFSTQLGIFSFFYEEPTFHDVSVPVFFKNTLYFTGFFGEGYIFAIDAISGKKKKILRLKDLAPSSVLTDGNLLFTGFENGAISAFDLQSLEQKWTVAKPTTAFFVTAVSQGNLFFTGLQTLKDYKARGDGFVGAMDAATGQYKWSFKTKGLPTIPAIATNHLVFGDEDDKLFALDLRTGQQLWMLDVSNSVVRPAIEEGKVIFTDRGGNLKAVSLETGKMEWKAKLPDKVKGVLSVFGKTAFVCGAYNSVYAVDITNGELKWTFKTGRLCYSPSILTSNAQTSLLFLCEDNQAYSISTDGQLLWKTKSENQLTAFYALAGETLYSISKEGFAYAFR